MLKKCLARIPRVAKLNHNKHALLFQLSTSEKRMFAWEPWRMDLPPEIFLSINNTTIHDITYIFHYHLEPVLRSDIVWERYCFSNSGTFHVLRVFDSLFENNKAGTKGGCISTHYSDHSFHRCIFRKNTAAERGGALSFNQPNLIFFEDTHFGENKTLEYLDNAKDFAFNLNSLIQSPRATTSTQKNGFRLDYPPLLVERPKQRAQNPSQRRQNLICEQHRVMIETKRGTSGRAAEAASARSVRALQLHSHKPHRPPPPPTPQSNPHFPPLKSCAVGCEDNLRSDQVQQRENRKVA
ncbi:hypothetical protein BLNAU_24113 [Blattamonas nauphoetae]|uniref:Uncharacterized protein n=1 Tax=Blattamonas nauphoetae TaxID=2049346 RepID=A0ABQ9WND6_9EUKA|nr:hypothetical protein BLNAU_24113 [Blattamonas nauphoetae]